VFLRITKWFGSRNHPHPGPLPEYREREKKLGGQCPPYILEKRHFAATASADAGSFVTTAEWCHACSIMQLQLWIGGAFIVG
jgi:hypothetical protein